MYTTPSLCAVNNTAEAGPIFRGYEASANGRRHPYGEELASPVNDKPATSQSTNKNVAGIVICMLKKLDVTWRPAWATRFATTP